MKIKIVILLLVLSMALCSCRADCSIQAVSGGASYCEQETQ